MHRNSSIHFYSNLEEHSNHVCDILRDSTYSNSVPNDWHVIVTDVKNSSIAIAEGNHFVVNLIATGSIIAILNIAKNYKISVPYFFGGDGATIIIPKEIKDECIKALKKHQDNSFKNYGLFLRVGEMPVADVYENNHQLEIAKSKVNDLYSMPIIIGGGLHYAERIIKKHQNEYSQQDIEDYKVNLEGMECRWDKIKPPSTEHKVLSLLVTANNNDEQRAIYADILDALESIYGPHQERSPVTINGLNLKASWKHVHNEQMIREGSKNIKKLIKQLIYNVVGKAYVKYDSEVKEYLTQLVQLTETLVLDGRLNTVITGSKIQHDKLIAYLTKLEASNKINFGYHTSSECIMSCYVRDRKGKHVHFVDGGNGGYTKAANTYKSKLNKQK